MLTVAEIMTREPYTLSADDSLATARQLMTEHHIRHIPVVSVDNDLVGLVSHRDILSAADSSILNEVASGDSRDQYVAISSIMSYPVQTATEHTGLRAAAMRLQQHKLGCLPVLNKSKLVGIITDADFVSIAINLMEQLEETEPEEDDFDEL
ncbi:MAG: CBS domain-containing protein [Halioglobus sp.]